MILLDGKNTSMAILKSLQEKIAKNKLHPRLDLIVVGNHPASLKYVELKQKKATEIGIVGDLHLLPSETTTDQLITKINELNNNPEVSAFMVQLPLPKTINTPTVLSAISPQKDADGLNPINLGKVFANDSTAIASATALGIMQLLREYKVSLSGKNAVIINNSPTIGLPLAALLNNDHATVTICHEFTDNFVPFLLSADIIISAVGKPKLITGGMIKKNAIVIDVGLSPDPITGKLVGDVDFESVSSKCSFITPVPGGVGPMTVASLLSNTVKIAYAHHSL